MEKEEESAIEEAFKKETGIDIYDAISFLNKKGITLDMIEKITDKVKKTVANEIEIRDVPYEYRFLTLNVVLCIMFQISMKFNKIYTEAVDELDKDTNPKKISISRFINNRKN